jgi:5-formyltetrahydrofolate cyclo-ligase
VAERDIQDVVRQQVWEALRTVGRPDSRFHWDFSSFIADFEGSEVAAQRVAGLEAWDRSDLLFITPDNSTEALRRLAIEAGKPFLMTTYGIRRGFLLLEPEQVADDEVAYAATLDGMDRLARPVSLADMADLGEVGLLVTGGSAVTRSGLRVGKGHGFFDVECALFSELGMLSAASEIVDVVHDVQIVDVEVAAGPNDVGVDWIVTPTQVLRVDEPVRGPGRILWELIPGTEFEDVPPIAELAAMRGQMVSEPKR